MEDSVTYREFFDRLTYLTLRDPTLANAESLAITVRYRANFSDEGALLLGIQDRLEWNFAFAPLDSGTHRRLRELPLVVQDGNVAVLATDPSLVLSYDSVDEFLNSPPPYSRVAVGGPYELRLDLTPRVKPGASVSPSAIAEYVVDDVQAGHYSPPSFTVDALIRGGASFYTYVENGRLSVSFVKQDLNWYIGPDTVMVQVYGMMGEDLGSFVLEDDGDVSEARERGSPQLAVLKVPGLNRGIYQIRVLASHDVLISQFTVNQRYLVAQGTLFLAGFNTLYTRNPFLKTVLYVGASYSGSISLLTPHEAGLQDIALTDGTFSRTISLKLPGETESLSVPSGTYALVTPRQDVVISTDMYVSFTPDSYFEPLRVFLVPFHLNYDWLVTSADYLVLHVPEEDDGWLLGRVIWKSSEFALIGDSVRFAIYVVAAAQDGQEMSAVQVDWVLVEAHIPPIWRR
jgi:hypothetical protein